MDDKKKTDNIQRIQKKMNGMQFVCLQLEASCLQWGLFTCNCFWEHVAYNWSLFT